MKRSQTDLEKYNKSISDIDRLGKLCISEGLEENDINVIDLIFEAKFITSKSEARRLIASNGLSMDGKLITDISLRVTKEELKEGILFKKGKKAFLNIKLK